MGILDIYGVYSEASIIITCNVSGVFDCVPANDEDTIIAGMFDAMQGRVFRKAMC